MTRPGRRDCPYITYAHLVIAVVASTDLSALPGVAEHAFPFKTFGDAFDLLNHLITVLERAEAEENPGQKSELLAFAIMGGGYTRVEVAAEIRDFVSAAARSYRNVDPGKRRIILL